jgi:simple sugar transport system ATP-binding protein
MIEVPNRDGGSVAPDRPVVEAVDIDKHFGSTVALREAGIVVHSGQSHALVGRNGAGKSTMVSILTGLEAPDAGRVMFGGEPAPPLGDREAWRRRVACVYQKSTVIPTLSVAENLFLNRFSTHRSRLISWPTIRREAKSLLAQWQVDVDVNQPASMLTVDQRQFVEIARALSFGARFIILDEPTAQLDGAGITRLFARIRHLQQRGVTFLFISHHLQEIYEICDTVTVFRDARRVLTAPVAQVTTPALVAAMTGEDVHLPDAGERPPLPDGAATVLELRGLETGGGAPVSFCVRAGEVVGLAGGSGSGKLEVAECIVGLRRGERGDVRINGRTPRAGSVAAALAAGASLVPQDRHRQGFVPLLSIAENITMTVPDKISRAGFINPTRRRTLAWEVMAGLSVKASGPDAPVSSLSGGNQQKVVLGRALASDPAVLVLITPTAGVDVRSKQSLLTAVDNQRRAGAAILIVSDELDDLRACDRVLVMFQGQITEEYARGWRDGTLVAAMEGIHRESA